MAWWAVFVCVLGGESSASTSHGNAWQASSQNFVVRNHHPAHDARQVALHCEQWRARLHDQWAEGEQPAWTPRCEVTVHATATSYLSVVGQGGRQTFGSSLVSFSSGQEVARRSIDFRGDSPAGLAAVPHELTHVVLADWMQGRQPPRWADEGLAILADSAEKQRLHQRDLAQGLTHGTAFRVAELLAIDTYPPASRVAAFYGQSASLTACLARRGRPAQFIAFLRQALDAGYDQALRDVYQIQNVAELERHWRQSGPLQSGSLAPRVGKATLKAIHAPSD